MMYILWLVLFYIVSACVFEDDADLCQGQISVNSFLFCMKNGKNISNKYIF